MAEVGIYWAIALILGIVAIYLGMAKLKVNEIVAEVNGSRRTLEELFSTKTKKIVQLKAVLEPYANNKIKTMFSKLDRMMDRFIKSTTEEKIAISEDINSIVNRIIEESKNSKDLMLDEYYHTVIRELEAVNARLVYAKRAYLSNIEQYERMRKRFPFSIFPWPHWKRIKESKEIMLKKKTSETAEEKEKEGAKEEVDVEGIDKEVKEMIKKKKMEEKREGKKSSKKRLAKSKKKGKKKK